MSLDRKEGEEEEMRRWQEEVEIDRLNIKIKYVSDKLFVPGTSITGPRKQSIRFSDREKVNVF